MSRFKNILALVLLTAWSVAANHCKLEQLQGFHFLKCGPADTVSSHPQNECESDGCASIESGLYKTEDASASATIPLWTQTWLALVLPTTLQPDTATDFLPAAIPPELPQRWQFVFRTASPPRAPSLTS